MAGPVVPEPVRNKAAQAGATDWLATLPGLLDVLADDWNLRIGEPFGDGTEAYVAGVELADGTEAVLKLMVPRPREPRPTAAAEQEIAVLDLVGGRGCAELLRSDAARGAMLLERLGPALVDLNLPIGERLEILATVATDFWRPAPEVDLGLRTGDEKGRWLVGYITEMWEALDDPCSERVIDHALACAERRIAAHDNERAMLVHGDVHQWNVLQSTAGFKLIDPDGLLAEPAYDLGVLMREDPVELLDGDPRDRSRWLAQRCGVDEQAIWEWGVVERVSTALLATSIDLQPIGREMLHAAEVIAASDA